MDLGVRQIRTAGKGSGSIELTLPSELRDLVGVPCKVTLRDGSRPDIVLRPDLQRVHDALDQLWRKMVQILLPGEPIPFPTTVFTFGLQPRSGGEGPYLCWRDGLALAGVEPYDANAVSRTLSAFAQAMAEDIGIAPTLASGFGAACGARVTGTVPDPMEQEACDLAALHLPPVTPPLTQAGQALDDTFWDLATPVLQAVSNLFTDFTTHPANHARLRAAWKRGRAIELGGEWA
jgi:hypothetical protein